jgi:hypothetical protein
MHVRRIFFVIFAFWLCGQIVVARADTFSLADGSSLTGDVLSFNDNGITFRLPDSSYTNLLWTKFSQDGLNQLAKNPKIKPLVEPFIEIPLSERPHKPEIVVKDSAEMQHLELPAKQSLLGALFSSSVGLFALALIYAGNLYAANEIAVFRARPKALVLGVAAVLPILGPIIFLSLPTQVETVAESAPTEAEVTPVAAPVHPVATEQVAAEAAASSLPVAQPAGQIFKRGQFTFNRRFIETKFSSFFSATTPADHALLVKISSGQFEVQRITRITATEVYFEVLQNGAPQEIMATFADIQEIQLQPKTA